MGNGFIDADGAQSHVAERVSGAQGVQLVGRHLTSMVSGGIAGAGSQLGAGDDVGAETLEEGSGIPRPMDLRERSRRAQRRWTQQNIWNGKYEGSE